MLTRFGHFVTSHARAILAVTLFALIGAAVLGSTAFGNLQSEGFDDPAVVGERGRRVLLRVVEAGGPDVTAVLGETCDGEPEAVERALEHRVPDGEAPEGAGLTGFGVGVGLSGT